MTHDDQPDWPERQARVIGAEVRRHRTRLGLSAQQVADRCAELGLPISRSLIANMENHRRPAVTAAELTVLGAALEVAPIQLLYPPIGVDVEVLPGREVSPWAALGWFTGAVTPDGLPIRSFASPAEIQSDHLRFENYVIHTRSHVDAAKSDVDRALAEAVASEAELSALIAAEAELSAGAADPARRGETARLYLKAVMADYDTAVFGRAAAEQGLRDFRAALRAAGVTPPPLPSGMTGIDPEPEDPDGDSP